MLNILTSYIQPGRWNLDLTKKKKKTKNRKLDVDKAEIVLVLEMFGLWIIHKQTREEAHLNLSWTVVHFKGKLFKTPVKLSIEI